MSAYLMIFIIGASSSVPPPGPFQNMAACEKARAAFLREAAKARWFREEAVVSLCAERGLPQ